MIAVKKNEEVKILDMQKDEYIEKGYTILDDKMKIIAKPFSKDEEKIKKLEKKVVDLEKEKSNLKTENEKLEKKAVDLEAEIAKLKK